jgi:hypothetical protein
MPVGLGEGADPKSSLSTTVKFFILSHSRVLSTLFVMLASLPLYVSPIIEFV